MKFSILIASLLLVTASLQADNTTNYENQDKQVYTNAQKAGADASKIKNNYLNTKEKCNVAYGHLSLNTTEESHIDTYIKGFFEACTHPHS